VHWDGTETITSQDCLDALEVPMHARNGAACRRVTKLLRAHGWEPIRIKLNGIDGGGVTERVRGYQRKTDRLPYPNVSKELPGKIDTSTKYVIGKVVSRLEMDSRWALARSVRALVAERDELKGKLEGAVLMSGEESPVLSRSRGHEAALQSKRRTYASATSQDGSA
jgi:hypothetical protein